MFIDFPPAFLRLDQVADSEAQGSPHVQAATSQHGKSGISLIEAF
jgi:hypothetical protein